MRPGTSVALLGVVGLLGGLSGLEATPLEPETSAEIDALFDEWDRWDSPGASLAILRDGEIVYSRGYGMAQLEYGQPITPTTPFHVASVSKQFTDFSAVLLEQDGKLSLDDDVRQHVAEVPDFGTTITLRQLAHHTSGLRDQWELLAISGTRLDDVITRDHILALVARQRELNFPPGSEHLYCNTGYTLLAETVARVSGQSFPVFTRERVFKPLGMAHTHFHDDHRHVVPRRAYSYEKDDEGGWQTSVLSFANAGATSLFTTAEDLARWMANLESGRVGGEEAIETMLTRGVLTDGEEIPYALGLVHGELRGLRTISHGGSDAGFRSTFLWFPDQRTGVVVLANTPSVEPGRRAAEVAGVLLGDLMEPLPEEELEGGEPVLLELEQLERLVGAYRLEGLGALVTVTRRYGTLSAEVPGAGEVELAARSPSDFVLEEPKGRIAFDLPADGEPATGFRVEADGQAFEGVRIEPLEGLDASEYEGWYLSPELETLYRITAGPRGLRAVHARNDAVQLVALGDDRFQGDQWWFGGVEFVRDGEGRVSGLRLSGGRVRDLRFERVVGDELGLGS